MSTATLPFEKTKPLAGRQDLHQVALRYCVITIWLFPVLTFTWPGRQIPTGLQPDALTLIKLASLSYALFVGLWLLYERRRNRETREAIVSVFFLLVFLGWSILSVVWSPLKLVTFAQAGGLTALLLLCIHVASLSRDHVTVSLLLRNVCWSLFAHSLVTFAAFAYDPVFSGLDRSIMLVDGDGLVHPTAAGATSAIGLLLSTLCLMTGRFPWARNLLIAAVLVHVPVLYLSHSRSAAMLALLLLPFAVVYFGSLRVKACASILCAIFLTLFIAVDPGFESLRDRNGPVVDYLLRGQSLQQIRDVSGRREMWGAIWNEFHHAPIRGHGYFVTSPTGSLLVWNVHTNHTAHNILLQVLVSTGLVGFVLWIMGLAGVFFRTLRLIHRDGDSRKIFALLMFVVAWFVGWTVGCVSFMGPIRAESIVFFTLMGIGLGLSSRKLPETAPSESL